MKLRYFVAVVIWIATVTATLESDSHGNWSNEKEVSEYAYEQKVFSNQTKEETKCGENQPSNQHERIFNSSKTDRPPEVEQEEAVKFINRNSETYEVVGTDKTVQIRDPASPV